MLGLTRLLSFSLILTTTILFDFSGKANAQSPDAKPKGTASISGHVTIGGKAAAGIPVAAFGGDSLNRRAAAARTITDSEGHYRLSGLAPAQYQVATLTPSLTTAEREPETYYGLVYFGSSKNIILSAAEEVDDIDLKLVRGGVITGRVTDADNKPVIEEHVALQPVDEGGNPSRTRPQLPSNGQMYQTDDRGVYRIYGLPAGRYKVSVGANSGEGTVSPGGRGYYPQTFYPDVNDVAKATVVDLGEGSEAANIDIQVGRRADTYSVAGHVVDSETGLPIAGARVGYGPAPQNQERFNAYYSGFPAGSRGEFRFEGLAPGRYAVNVSPENDGGDVYSDPVYFNIVDKDVSGLEVKAVHGLSLSGVVVTDGETQKDLLAQLAGLRISASVSSTSKPQIYTSGSSRVGADGSFQINGLRPGRAGIGFYTQGPGSKRPSITRIEHDGVELTQGFEVQPGQSISGLRVVISFGTGAIRGTVRFEGGTPPADTRMFIRCTREGGREGNGAQLDSRGRFLISGLAPGTYEVRLDMMVAGGSRSSQRPLTPQKQLVTVTNDAEAEVTFIVDLRPKEVGP